MSWVSGWTCTYDSCQWVTGWQRRTNLHISPVVLAGITLFRVVTYSFSSTLNFVRLFLPHSVSCLRLLPCTSSSTEPSSIFTAATVTPPICATTAQLLELGRCWNQIDLALCCRWRYRRSWVIIFTRHVGTMPMNSTGQLTHFGQNTELGRCWSQVFICTKCFNTLGNWFNVNVFECLRNASLVTYTRPGWPRLSWFEQVYWKHREISVFLLFSRKLDRVAPNKLTELGCLNYPICLNYKKNTGFYTVR